MRKAFTITGKSRFLGMTLPTGSFVSLINNRIVIQHPAQLNSLQSGWIVLSQKHVRKSGRCFQLNQGRLTHSTCSQCLKRKGTNVVGYYLHSTLMFRNISTSRTTMLLLSDPRPTRIRPGEDAVAIWESVELFRNLVRLTGF